MTPDEVATILGMSPRTVHKLVRDGKLACVKVTERERRFTREQVKTYIACQSTQIIDKNPKRRLPSTPKGGAKSFGGSRTDLLKEIRSL